MDVGVSAGHRLKVMERVNREQRSMHATDIVELLHQRYHFKAIL